MQFIDNKQVEIVIFDSTRFYDFTKKIIAEQKLKVLQDSDDVYAWDEIPEHLANIQTFYEKMWLADGK
jgi:hypothetical protein